MKARLSSARTCCGDRRDLRIRVDRRGFENIQQDLGDCFKGLEILEDTR